MRRAAAVVVAGALVLPAAQAAPRKIVSPVLGLDVAKNGVHRLAWFEPGSLTMLRGRKVPLGRYVGSWSFSPDRSLLAVAAANTTGYQHQPEFKLRFVNARSMRVVGHVALPTPSFGWINWLRPDRLLAIVYESGDRSLVVVDPVQRAVVRREPLSRPPWGVVRVADELALLLGSEESFAPAVVAVADAEGAVRTVTLERISIGSVTTEGPTFESRRPGFAVDAAGRRAFVVGADFTVADVDLDTLRVTYHGGSARSLAKYAYGPTRSAVWLGNGLLAVAGTDYSGDELKGEPLGLRIVDTRDWRVRVVDAKAAYVRQLPDNTMFATGEWPHYDVYGADGTLRYSLDLGEDESLNVAGGYGYVCGIRKNRLVRVLDVRTGAPAVALRGERPFCPYLLYDQSRNW